ncbi:MAG TPA: SulP family inorganic anion transporter [Bacteroidia bacterium]
MKKSFFKDIKSDVPAGLVVFFVALPLCLAIAQVSTGKTEFLFSGIIAGIIGGIVVGFLSGSSLGVSGPAAGLVVIVSDGMNKLGTMADGSYDPMHGFKGLLLAICIAGLIQLIAGFLKAGIIGNYFPSSVIKGMLAAIGITIILKELPHALGYDKDYLGDMSFDQPDGHNTFTEIYYALIYNSPAAIVISILSVILLMVSEHKKVKNWAIFKYFPAALFVVIAGVLFNLYGSKAFNVPALDGEHLVQLPVAGGISEFFSFFTLPDFTRISDPRIWSIGLSIAMVASIETLLSLEATDKLDPLKRSSSGNKELKAQGVGNLLSGLVGGLPITQVIVRSSANINSGGKSKLSTIIHGAVLLIAVIFIPAYLNYIPLATLAAILLLIGYKLAKVSLFKSMYKLGPSQFIPFVVTIVAILATDLLKGIAVGMLIAFFIIIRENYRNTFKLLKDDKDSSSAYRMELSDMVTFINKGILLEAFNSYPDGAYLIIDGSKTRHFDHDVLEVIHEFAEHKAALRNIQVTLIDIPKLESVAPAH